MSDDHWKLRKAIYDELVMKNKDLFESFIDRTIDDGPVLSMEKVRVAKLNTFQPINREEFSIIRKKVFPNTAEEDVWKLRNRLTDEGYLTVISRNEPLIYPKTLYALSEHAREHHGVQWDHTMLIKGKGLLPIVLGKAQKTVDLAFVNLKYAGSQKSES